MPDDNNNLNTGAGAMASDASTSPVEQLLEALEGMVRRHAASQQNWVQAVMDAQHSGDHELSASLRNTALQALDHFPIEQARAAIAKARGEQA